MKTKKLLAILLSALMVMSLCISAGAAGSRNKANSRFCQATPIWKSDIGRNGRSGKTMKSSMNPAARCCLPSGATPKPICGLRPAAGLKSAKKLRPLRFMRRSAMCRSVPASSAGKRSSGLSVCAKKFASSNGENSAPAILCHRLRKYRSRNNRHFSLKIHRPAVAMERMYQYITGRR